MERYTRAEFEEATEAVRSRTDHAPRIGVVLGSGLGGFAASVEDADEIPSAEIPHWPHSTVPGHVGRLYLGQLEGQNVLVMSGRAHYYEGYPMSRVTLPIRVMQLLGAEIVILTNAAGGLDPSYSAGDLMLLSDHINIVGMAGANPLRGPNDETLGTRFPDMSEVYDARLRAIAQEVAREADVPLHEGIYAGVAGPSFETPAEIRFLRMIGASAVGMSTVHEAIVARHGGMRVLGISGVSNVAVSEAGSHVETTHEEVLDAGRVIVPRLEAILRGVLRALPAAASA